MAGGVARSIWQVVFTVGFIWSCYCSMAEAERQTAAFYTPPYVPSACYKNDPSQFPVGNLFAAASDALWEDGAACGRLYKVRCIKGTNDGVPKPCKSGSTVVEIVDFCPPGCAATIVLSQEAFARIAVPQAGKVFVEFEQV